jgi:hypothetical protein
LESVLNNVCNKVKEKCVIILYFDYRISLYRPFIKPDYLTIDMLVNLLRYIVLLMQIKNILMQKIKTSLSLLEIYCLVSAYIENY